MNKSDRGLLVVIMMMLFAAICLLSVDLVKHSQMERELAATRSEVTTGHGFGGDEGVAAIREAKGRYYGEGAVVTEDGNVWSVNTEDIIDCEVLLIWFDTLGTDSIEDDQIIEIWRTIYD